jgi:hypothetical protein
MHDARDWADAVSSKIWSAPLDAPTADVGFTMMDVEWRSKSTILYYLENLWGGVRALQRRIYAYAKLKQG